MHSASCEHLHSRRTKQTLVMFLPKVVSGGSYVSSIKTASDNNNASNNKNNKNENDIVNSDNNQSGLKRI